MKYSEPIFPSPEDIWILEEETQERYKRAESLVDLIFRRKELFDAWYQFTKLSNSIAQIAHQHEITWYQAQKRIQTAQTILLNFHQSLHKVDDS